MYDFSVDKVCEVAAVKLKLSSLFRMYRNQGNIKTSLEIISQVLESIPANKPVVIMGYVNIDSLKKMTIPKWEINQSFND